MVFALRSSAYVAQGVIENAMPSVCMISRRYTTPMGIFKPSGVGCYNATVMIANGKAKASAARRTPKPRTRPEEAELEIDDAAAREIISRLARVEGQVRAIQRMIDERRDCHAIVQQLGAARTALERATAKLMVGSLAQCIRAAKSGADEAEVQRLMDTFVKLL
jgi:DNA-binding FrmR family transcriptional regulator